MSRRTKKNIGVIGLGIIGSRIREALRRKGYHVFVWNRTPRPVPNFVGAPAELAEMCDYIQIFVSDDDALLYVAKQLSPGLAARHMVFAHSTVSPHTMTAAAEIIQRRGARFIEAPFTGSKEAAEKGELVYYVGADEAALKEARPILEASAKQIMEFGEVGQATAIKIATNMVTAASIQATAEALALVQATGIPLEKFAAAMRENASNSKTLAMKLPKMIAANYEPHFSVKHMLKDLQIANRLGLANHLELGVTAAARDRLAEQVQQGHGDADYSAVARKYFPDVPTAAAEAGLELFEAKAPAPPSFVDSLVPDTGESNKELEPVPVLSAAAVLAEASLMSSGSLAFSDSAPESAVPENAEASLLEELPEETSAEPEEEPPSPRGFFGRLLRRGT